jgi:hypothetical protein
MFLLKFFLQQPFTFIIDHALEGDNMRIHRAIRKLIKSDALLKFFSGYEGIKSEFNLYLAKITDSKPFQLIQEYKRPVALFLHIMWLAGFGYWCYHLMTISVRPKDNLGLVVTDSRDALAILFFGTLGVIFVLSFVFFIIKFIYNLFHEGIESLFSVRWHSLVKPVSYLVILCCAFSFTATIKATGLTAYNQIAELVHASQRHSLVVEKEMPDDLEKKLSSLIKILEKDGRE